MTEVIGFMAGLRYVKEQDCDQLVIRAEYPGNHSIQVTCEHTRPLRTAALIDALRSMIAALEQEQLTAKTPPGEARRRPAALLMAKARSGTAD